MDQSGETAGRHTAGQRVVLNPPATVRGWRKAWRIAHGTAEAYFTDKVPQLGAALAFYMMVAVVPLMVLAIAAAGLIFGTGQARERVLEEVEQLGGISRQEAASIAPTYPQLTSATAWIGFIAFLFGGFGVFSHLQDALNVIWRAPLRTREPWLATVRRRLLSYGTVLVAAFIVLVSLVLSAVLAWLGQSASKWAGWPAHVAEACNFGFSFVIVALLFGVIFKLLPDVRIRWRDVWFGSGVTSLLFTLGKTLLGIYLAGSRVTSGWGAAGSAIALLIWCYYAGQIVFLGAELTRVRAWVNEGRDLNPPTGRELLRAGATIAVPSTDPPP